MHNYINFSNLVFMQREEMEELLRQFEELKASNQALLLQMEHMRQDEEEPLPEYRRISVASRVHIGVDLSGEEKDLANWEETLVKYFKMLGASQHIINSVSIVFLPDTLVID